MSCVNNLSSSGLSQWSIVDIRSALSDVVKMALDSAAEYNQLNTESKTTTKEEAIDLLSPKENDKVLDIGCGTGEITSILAELVWFPDPNRE